MQNSDNEDPEEENEFFDASVMDLLDNENEKVPNQGFLSSTDPKKSGYTSESDPSEDEELREKYRQYMSWDHTKNQVESSTENINSATYHPTKASLSKSQTKKLKK